MYKYIFFDVITIDETIATLNVEPFYSTGYFASYKEKKIQPSIQYNKTFLNFRERKVNNKIKKNDDT